VFLVKFLLLRDPKNVWMRLNGLTGAEVCCLLC